MKLATFSDRSGDLYSAMKGRFKEKRSQKTGRVTRVGRTLPFTITEFRNWLIGIFGAQVVNGFGNAVQCPYCGAAIDFWSAVLDHVVPVSRGGALSLDNICACCDDCNRCKGELSGSEYRALRKGIEAWPEPARRDVYQRLKMGRGFMRLRFFKKPQPGAQVQQQSKQQQLSIQEDF